MALTCLKRLDALGDDELTAAIVNQPSAVSKQICLYAMMKQYRLVWDFMITVIGSKYQKLDTSFGKIAGPAEKFQTFPIIITSHMNE